MRLSLQSPLIRSDLLRAVPYVLYAHVLTLANAGAPGGNLNVPGCRG